jgi:hypothetical protein
MAPATRKIGLAMHNCESIAGAVPMVGVIAPGTLNPWVGWRCESLQHFPAFQARLDRFKTAYGFDDRSDLHDFINSRKHEIRVESCERAISPYSLIKADTVARTRSPHSERTRELEAKNSTKIRAISTRTGA